MTSTALNLPVNEGPWYTHRWPWLLMLGPGAVVAAGIWMSMIAFQNQDALVVGDYYKQGKAINQDLRRDREAARLGLSARFGVEDGRLSGGLLSHGAPQAAAFELHLAHATQPEKDIRLFIKTGADGRFSVNLPPLAASRYQVQLADSARQWRLEGAWTYPKQVWFDVRADQE